MLIGVLGMIGVFCLIAVPFAGLIALPFILEAHDRGREKNMTDNVFVPYQDVPTAKDDGQKKTLTILGLPEVKRGEKVPDSDVVLMYNTAESELLEHTLLKRWRASHRINDSYGSFYFEERKHAGCHFLGVFKSKNDKYFIYLYERRGSQKINDHCTFIGDSYEKAKYAYKNYIEKYMRREPEDCIKDVV
jgi:hypothetical protein